MYVFVGLMAGTVYAVANCTLVTTCSCMSVQLKYVAVDVGMCVSARRHTLQPLYGTTGRPASQLTTERDWRVSSLGSGETPLECC